MQASFVLSSIVRFAMIRLVRERGGRVWLRCPRALAPILSATPGIDRLVPDDVHETPPHDVYDASLRVDLGFNYESSAYGYTPDFKELDIQDLQPSDESKGSYDFQAKDGTHPVALELVRKGTDDACRDLQHRGPDKSTPEKVTLSLRNLPEPAN